MWTLSDLSPLLVLLGLVTFIFWHCHRQSTFWSRRGVPFKKPHVIFGSFNRHVTGQTSVAESVHEIHKSFKGEPFVGVWECSNPIFFVRDPELVRTIFVKDFSNWTSRGIIVNEDVDPLSGHLVNLNGKRWKVVRSKLTPTFTSGKLKQMYHLLNECGQEFENYLKAVAASGKPVEAREMTARFTTDVIGSCVFGIQMNSLSDENAEFREMGRKMFKPTGFLRIYRMIQRSFPTLFKILKLSLHSKEMTDFFVKVIRDTFEYREINDVQRHDFVDLLRKLKDTKNEDDSADDVEFDINLLTAQAFVFFAAGFETSSSTISYCMHELAVNQDIQQRLRDEIHKTKAKNNGEITFDAIKDMEYLDQVFNETLRKYPPIPVIRREATGAYTVPGTDVKLPSGMTALVPIYAIHHDPEYYPEPKKFDPERFSEEAQTQRNPFAFIPFGGGPRICIGLRFAELQTKLGLAKVVDKFELSLCEKSQNPLEFHKKARFLVPAKGIWLRITVI